MEWIDPVLGPFLWDPTAFEWKGTCEFNGRTVRLVLCPDHINPTPDEQMAVFEPSRSVVARLREVEKDFRRRAAAQMAAAVISQQHPDAQPVPLPQEQFADGLELEGVSLHECGELHYRSDDFFPSCFVTIYFDENVSFGDVEVYEVNPE